MSYNDRFISQICAILLGIVLISPHTALAQKAKTRVLVLGLKVESRSHIPYSQVIETRLIRDLLTSGKAVIVSHEEREAAFKSMGRKSHTCGEFDCAMKLGEKTNADYVIYGTLERRFIIFQFDLTIIKLPSGITEKNLKRKFQENSRPPEIAKEASVVSDAFLEVIPQYRSESPEKMFAQTFPQEAIVDSLPEKVLIALLTEYGKYGPPEVILHYHKIYPGLKDWENFMADDITKMFNYFKHMGNEVATSLSKLYAYGNFFNKFDMEAYAIKNCSVGALDMLLALEIPVLMVYRGNIRILTGYRGLPESETSYFYLDGGEILPTNELTGFELRWVLFAVNKPGRYRGHSRAKLEKAIGRFKDTWNDTPELVAVVQ